MPQKHKDSGKKTVQEKIADSCPEIKRLPKDWRFNVSPDGRIMYQKTTTREQTYTHPTFGGLPEPWILHVTKDGKVEYYNRNTKATNTHDPRYMERNIQSGTKYLSEGMKLAASIKKNRKDIDVTQCVRGDIATHDIRDQFQIIHTIDAGDGKLGGMNGGVFVVVMKKVENRMYVEKRFKKGDVDIAQKEIEMLHRVKHCSLTFFMAGFILPDLSDASLYVEFCDRGSLEDVMKEYTQRSNQIPRPRVPEAFVWHAFAGLCDGLAYLQTGRIQIRKKASGDPNWIPILHRDIKPDNVLLRSRSTIGTGKYFYCVLSDFGLACEDFSRTDPRCDYWQKSGSRCGTSLYFAPELLHNPYPTEGRHQRYFPEGQRHTCYSDLWSLGASIYNLCAARLGEERGTWNHTTLAGKPPYMQPQAYREGRASRPRNLLISNYYSKQLRTAINQATEFVLGNRKSPKDMIKTIERLMKESGFNEQGTSDPIPDWATRVHEYHSKAEKVSLQEQSSKKNPRPPEPHRPPQMPFPPPIHYNPAALQQQFEEQLQQLNLQPGRHQYPRGQ